MQRTLGVVAMCMLVVVLVPCQTSAQTTADEHIIDRALGHDWALLLEKRPGYELVELFPDRAMRNQMPGETEMRCKVLPDGRMGTCVITREQPKDFGFGAAALRAAQYFKLRGAFGPNATVDIPLHWNQP